MSSITTYSTELQPIVGDNDSDIDSADEEDPLTLTPSTLPSNQLPSSSITLTLSRPAGTMSSITTDSSELPPIVGDNDSDIDRNDSANEVDTRSKGELLDDFCSDWIATLDKDDKQSLAIFLSHMFVKHHGMKLTTSAELVASVIGKNEKTVRRWRTALIQNKGDLPESKQGKYERKGVLWHNEELNQMATKYIRNNSSVKGKPNMTTYDFCKWVNRTLLPSLTLEPGFPRKVSVSTCRQWLLQLGFEVITPRKGIFIDGHERADVVEDRITFLRRMVKLGFLHFDNAPTPDAIKAIPEDIEPPTADKRLKTVYLFHDETTFNSNDDQNLKWGIKGEKIMKHKSKGAGIMVSDFIDDHNGFLVLSDTEYVEAQKVNPGIKKYARDYLEYGENKEGYWNLKRFMAQITWAVEIAEFKYPKEQGWRLCWVFDNSSCHNAMAEDALNVNRMNVKPGGAQKILRDTSYDGKSQKMYFTDKGQKVAKGMKIVLEERGYCTLGKNKAWMKATLSQHADFRFEKSDIEKFLLKRGHIPTFLPKFHPELNPIERVWAQLKRHTRAHCNYTIRSLRVNIPNAFDSVTIDNIRNHFRKVRHFMFGYLEGLIPGKELDQKLKKYKKAVQSHRRIGETE